MKPYLILTILFVFLSTAVIVSCQKEKSPYPSSTNYGVTTPAPINNRNIDLSPVSATDAVFYFLKPSTYPVSCYGTYCTERTRYIWHNDGTFVLQYDEGNEYTRGFEYKGRYTQTHNIVLFTWEGWSTAGPWGATGTLTGDTLRVEYNIVMALSGFEDATYLRKR